MTDGDYTFSNQVTIDCTCDAGGGLTTLNGSGLTGGRVVNLTGIGGNGYGGIENQAISMGAATWNLTGGFDMTYITTLTAGTSTLVMQGTSTLTSNGKTLNNLQINSSSAVTLAAASHTVAGNFLLAGSGSPTTSGSTVVMTGAPPEAFTHDTSPSR